MVLVRTPQVFRDLAPGRSRAFSQKRSCIFAGDMPASFQVVMPAHIFGCTDDAIVAPGISRSPARSRSPSSRIRPNHRSAPTRSKKSIAAERPRRSERLPVPRCCRRRPGSFSFAHSEPRERRPDPRRELPANVEKSVARGREEPLVRAREIGVASDVVEVDGNLTGGLRAVDHRQDPSLAGERADLPDRVDRAERGRDVRPRDHARARRDARADDLDPISSGERAGTGIFSVFQTIPWRFERCSQPHRPPGCSWSVCRISSPEAKVEAEGHEIHPHGGVLREGAISSGAAWTTCASFSRIGISAE